MIPRYARHDMVAIWEPESRYGIWLEIETLAMEAMAELGTIPKSAADEFRRRGKFDVARIDEIEREVKPMTSSPFSPASPNTSALSHASPTKA